MDSRFKKRDNQTGELKEFEGVKSYKEFKERYWESVDKSGESGIINNKECDIHPDKINKFFLQPGAKEFFNVGYTENDSDILKNDLRNAYDYSKAVDKTISDNGVEKFSIFTKLGINKKKTFRTVWQKDTADSKPRIITAHREDEKDD